MLRSALAASINTPRVLCAVLSFFIFALPLNLALAAPPSQTPTCTTTNPTTDPSLGPRAPTCTISVDDSLTEHFGVTWISPAAEVGSLKLAGGGTANDVRGSTFKGPTHYVQLDTKQPNVNYQFTIISGSKTFDKNGSNWSIGGPWLVPPSAQSHLKIRGRVQNADGTDATEAVVYVQVKRANGSASSAVLSKVMTDSDAGFFIIDLAYARTPDLTARFSFDQNSDKITVTAVGRDGWAAAPDRLITSMVQTQPILILMLGNGNGTAVTVTPSSVPPTSTLTPLAPTATPTPAPLTATAAAATRTAAAFPPTRTVTPSPRPIATRPPPTLIPVTPGITIAPAFDTLVLEGTPTSTEIATSEVTRIASAQTPAPNSFFEGRSITDTLIAVIVLGAFAGAVLLAGAAVFIWRRGL